MFASSNGARGSLCELEPFVKGALQNWVLFLAHFLQLFGFLSIPYEH